MVPDSSAICLRSSRIVSGSGSSSTRNWPHEPLPLFNEQNKVGLRAYQALRHGCAIEISRNQLLKFAGLQPHVEPGAGRCCGEGAEELKKRFPMLQVRIYDAQTKAREEVELPRA